MALDTKIVLRLFILLNFFIMKTKEKSLKGKVIKFFVRIYAFFAKLFPRFWFRYTVKSNPYAAYFLPNYTIEKAMFDEVKAFKNTVSGHLWSSEVRKAALRSSSDVEVFCEDIQNAKEFEILIKNGYSDIMQNACAQKQYTLSKKDTIGVCNEWPECVSILLKSQPNIFKTDVVKQFGKKALNAYLMNELASCDEQLVDYLLVQEVWSSRQIIVESFLKAHTGSIPKRKEVIEYVEENFPKVFAVWLEQVQSKEIFDLCFSRWNVNSETEKIEKLISLAKKQQSWAVLSQIAVTFRSKNRFYELVTWLLDHKVPCPELLYYFEPGYEVLFDQVFTLSCESSAISRIPEDVVKRLSPLQKEQYFLKLAETGQLKYEQFVELEGDLKSQVKAIQEDNALYQWLSYAGGEMISSKIHKGLKFSPRLQMMLLNSNISYLFKVLIRYGLVQGLETETLQRLMKDESNKADLIEYFINFKITEELKQYLIFTPCKDILPNL